MISIIVPIYKVEKYLKKCIDSIINQTYKNLEIILVDDGSPDGCGSICDSYSLLDKRIKVIHKENGGLSDARNTGINIARGEYLAFVDSDDFIHPQMIEILYNVVTEQKADIGICDFREVNEDGQYVQDAINADTEIVCYEGWDIMKQLQQKNLITVVAWNKLYRASLFENIRYPRGHVHEDEFVIHRILNKCVKTAYTNNKLYFYRKRPESIMADIDIDKMLDATDAYEDRITFLEKEGYGQILMDTKCQFCGLIIKYTELLRKNKYNKTQVHRIWRKFHGVYSDKKLMRELKKGEKMAFFLFDKSPWLYEQWIQGQDFWDKQKSKIRELRNDIMKK